MLKPYSGLLLDHIDEVVPLDELLYPVEDVKPHGWRRALKMVGNFLLSIVASALIVILSAIAVLLGVFFGLWMVFEVNGW